jgi:Pentapeptide repeats (9 copies)
MLTNFFNLNEPNTNIDSLDDFIKQLEISEHLSNIAFYAPNLKPNGTYNKLRITDKKFTNVSFSKTKFEKVTFRNCSFKDCLMVGTIIVDCEFHNCTFTNVNTHKITINNTYINPKSFVNNFKEFNKANIAIHLFHQLLNNSKDFEQSKFSRIAQYNFFKWENRVTFNKYYNKKPYPISFWEFIKAYPLNWLFKWSFGYGLRLRNFIITFTLVFSSFFLVNKSYWKTYKFQNKGIEIESISTDSTNIASNLYYTFEATTKLIDSQIQPTSSSGMILLTIQSVFGFVLFGALITIIFNRFVK